MNSYNKNPVHFIRNSTFIQMESLEKNKKTGSEKTDDTTSNVESVIEEDTIPESLRQFCDLYGYTLKGQKRSQSKKNDIGLIERIWIKFWTE